MLRISTEPRASTEQWVRWAFWLLNVGLAVVVFVSVLPVGFLQLEVTFIETYGAVRSLTVYNSEIIQLEFWSRLPVTR